MKNVVDYIIIVLMFISTIEVFLSTFSDIAEHYRPVLNSLSRVKAADTTEPFLASKIRIIC